MLAKGVVPDVSWSEGRQSVPRSSERISSLSKVEFTKILICKFIHSFPKVSTPLTCLTAFMNIPKLLHIELTPFV